MNKRLERMIVDATQKPPGEALPINRGIYHGLLNKFLEDFYHA